MLGLKSARGDYEAAARRAERAVAELQALDGELQQVSVLAARVAAAVTRRAELGEALGRAEQAAAEAEKLAQRAAENEANALQALTAYERREARLAAASELEQATRTHAAATALMREIGIARARNLAAQRVNAAAVRELEIVTRDLGAQAARLAAGAPSVRVDYVAGGSARVSLDGRALSDGEELRAIGPVELHIPGVGHITITPAASRERETAAAAARRFEERRLALLAAMQVPDLDAARAALADRQAREQALSGAEARLSGLAGAGDAEQGLAALAARIADFKQRLEVDAGAGEAAVSASRESCAGGASGCGA